MGACAFHEEDHVSDRVYSRSSIGSLSLRPAIPCLTLNPARHHARPKDSVPDRIRSIPSVPDLHRLKQRALAWRTPGPPTRDSRRRALLRQLHSLYTTQSMKAKAHLFITGTPSCLATPSWRLGMAAPPASFMGCGERPHCFSKKY